MQLEEVRRKMARHEAGPARTGRSFLHHAIVMRR